MKTPEQLKLEIAQEKHFSIMEWGTNFLNYLLSEILTRTKKLATPFHVIAQFEDLFILRQKIFLVDFVGYFFFSCSPITFGVMFRFKLLFYSIGLLYSVVPLKFCLNLFFIIVKKAKSLVLRKFYTYYFTNNIAI